MFLPVPSGPKQRGISHIDGAYAPLLQAIIAGWVQPLRADGCMSRDQESKGRDWLILESINERPVMGITRGTFWLRVDSGPVRWRVPSLLREG